jgi:CHAT domain-containing protein
MKKIVIVMLLVSTNWLVAQLDYKAQLVQSETAYKNSLNLTVSEQIAAELAYADALRINGRYNEALSINLKAHKKSQTLKKKGLAEQEQAQYQLGQLFVRTGNLIIADRVITQDVELAEKAFSKKDWRHARAMNMAGYMAIQTSDFVKADGYLNKAAQYLAEEPTSPKEILAQNNLYRAEYYRIKGSYAASEALLKMAMNTIKELPAGHEINAEAGILYSRLYKDLHNYGKAWRFLHRTEGQYAALNPKHSALMGVNLELTDLYLLAGANDSVSKMLNKILLPELSRNNKTMFYYDACRLNARFATRTKNFVKADSLYSELTDSIGAYIGDRSLYYANSLQEKAEYYYASGKYEEALGTWQLIVDIQKDLLDNSHASYIKALNGQAMVYWAQGRNALAASAFKKSASNYLTQFSKNFVFLNEKEKGLLYKDVRLFFDTYNMFILSDAMQNKGKSSLLSAMYDNQLSTKAFLFSSSVELKKFLSTTHDSMMLAKTEKWLRGKEQLSKLYKLDDEELLSRNISLDSIEAYVSNMEKEMSLRTALSTVGQEKEQPAWEEVRTALGAKEIAMEIIRIRGFSPDSGGSFNDKIYYATLVISPDLKSPELRYLEKGKDLEGKYVHYYRNTIRYGVTDTITYNMYWKPFCSTTLVGAEKIFLSVDGVYNKLSLNTLYDPESKTYILDKFNVHLLTNTKEIIAIKNKSASTAQKQNKNGTAVFFGFPDYNYKSTSVVTSSTTKKSTAAVTRQLQTRGDVRSSFRGGVISELPGTKVEVEGITTLFNRKEGVVIEKSLGKTAVESSLKQVHSPMILHIATHGFFMSPAKAKEEGSLLDDDSDNPLLLSGVLLSGASHAYSEDVILDEINGVLKGKQVDDGILSAYEAMNLDLTGTSLVVLSACETGLGEVKNGEGVFGLQRSLMTAGAESIVMSMWKVYDESTQKLMRYFYEEWIKTGDKRNSFIAAQKRLRLEYASPVHWGAFVMIGE